VGAFKSQWLQDFSLWPDPGGPSSPLYYEHQVCFPGVKQPGHGVEDPSPSSPKVKERVDLYLYLPSGPPWPFLGLILLYMETVFYSEKLVNFDCTAWQHVHKTIFI
jgi:hypothetical protein